MKFRGDVFRLVLSGSYYNIEDEDDKKEFFDFLEELEKKMDFFVKWVKESKYCVMFIGVGISISIGILDFRSGMNIVFKIGLGVWELKVKGVVRKLGVVIFNMLKVIFLFAYMVIVKLYKEGLFKFIVS